MNRRTFLKAITAVAGAIRLNQTAISDVSIADSSKYKLPNSALVSLYDMPPSPSPAGRLSPSVIAHGFVVAEPIEYGERVYLDADGEFVYATSRYSGIDLPIGLALSDGKKDDLIDVLVYGTLGEWSYPS